MKLAHRILHCLTLALWLPAVAEAQDIFASSFENDVAFADVQWAADTMLIEGDALAALISYDPGSGTFVFDSMALAKAGIALTSGDVLLVSGTGLGRIDTVTDSSGTTTVTTLSADLGDAIDSGRLVWHLDFGYDDLANARVQFGKGTCSPTIDGLTVSFECGFDDYTLTMTVTGGGAQSTIEFLIVKGLGDNATASFSGTGTISQFEQQAEISYSGGEVTNASVQDDRLRIDLVLSLAAAGSGSSDVRYTVPFPIFKIPFSVGPIPATIDIGAQTLAILNVPASFQASATGQARFSYSGTSGLTYDGSSATISAETTNVGFTDGSFDSAALLGVGFVEATFGIAVPRVSLNIFAQEVAYVLTGTLLRSIYYDGPICKEARTEFVIQGGYGLSILGIDLVPSVDEVLNRESLIVSSDGGNGCPQSNL